MTASNNSSRNGNSTEPELISTMCSSGNSSKKAAIQHTPISERINNILITKGLTKEKLAEHIGTTPVHLSRLINGRTKPCRMLMKMLSVIERTPVRSFWKSDRRKKTVRLKRKDELRRRAVQNARNHIAEDDRPYDPNRENESDTRIPCERCQADGIIAGRLCPDCGGEGFIEDEQAGPD